MTDQIDIRELRAKASKLGLRIRKVRDGYQAINADGPAFGGSLEAIAWQIDAMLRGDTMTFTTACGIPLYRVDLSTGEVTYAT